MQSAAIASSSQGKDGHALLGARLARRNKDPLLAVTSSILERFKANHRNRDKNQHQSHHAEQWAQMGSAVSDTSERRKTKPAHHLHDHPTTEVVLIDFRNQAEATNKGKKASDTRDHHRTFPVDLIRVSENHIGLCGQNKQGEQMKQVIKLRLHD